MTNLQKTILLAAFLVGKNSGGPGILDVVRRKHRISLERCYAEVLIMQSEGLVEMPHPNGSWEPTAKGRKLL